MKIYSGKYSVLESGMIIPDNGDSEIKFCLDVNEDSELNLKITFEDNGGERNLVRSLIKETNEIHFKCVNFKDGAGTIEPILLATVGDKNICFHFWMHILSDKNKTRRIDYTFFVEE